MAQIQFFSSLTLTLILRSNFAFYLFFKYLINGEKVNITIAIK